MNKNIAKYLIIAGIGFVAYGIYKKKQQQLLAYTQPAPGSNPVAI